MDTVYLLGEAVGIDTNISEVLGIEDQKGEDYGWRLFVSEVLWIKFISGEALWIRCIR